MLNKTRPEDCNPLSATVRACLQELEALALKASIYGDHADEENLRDIIARLRSASPTQEQTLKASTDFVTGKFKVSRRQVANTLWHAFTGEIGWFRITETIPPRTLRFRSIDQTNPGIVDYPLNEGGAVQIMTTAPKSEVFELRLDGIARGLQELAAYYPRHFADLVNENADAITADALLQCCIFGELIYS